MCVRLKESDNSQTEGSDIDNGSANHLQITITLLPSPSTLYENDIVTINGFMIKKEEAAVNCHTVGNLSTTTAAPQVGL
jgi:hypothetical protein